ncbi:MAG: hypothetical protein ACRDY7_06590 [Acidimicrobiia bacterium]
MQTESTAPVEVTIRLVGARPGESEVDITIVESSELGQTLLRATPEDAEILFRGLGRRLCAELTDAFEAIHHRREVVRSAG